MKCANCGAEVQEKLSCPYCGSRTTPQYVPYVGATVYDKNAIVDDVPNLILIFLAFLVPLFGIIYYFARVKVYKTKARAYGISALSGVAVTVLILVTALVMLLI